LLRKKPCFVRVPSRCLAYSLVWPLAPAGRHHPSNPSCDYCQETGRLSAKPLPLIRCFVTAQPLHKPLAAHVRAELPPCHQYPQQVHQSPRFSFSPSARSARETSTVASAKLLPSADGTPPSLYVRNGPYPRSSQPGAQTPHSSPPPKACQTRSRPRHAQEKLKLCPSRLQTPARHTGPAHGSPLSTRSAPLFPQAAPRKAVYPAFQYPRNVPQRFW
jgi:hypothetical protein